MPLEGVRLCGRFHARGRLTKSGVGNCSTRESGVLVRVQRATRSISGTLTSNVPLCYLRGGAGFLYTKSALVM